MPTHRLIILLCTASSLTAAENSADWPRFRGPTRQGLSSATNLPIHWNSTNNVAWKVPLHGKGWSSPVLANGRLYLTTSVAKIAHPGQSLHARCLDASTGAKLWSREVFAPEIFTSGHRKNSQASPTPIVAGDRLYVHFGPLGTACLDLAGGVLWTNRSFSFDTKHGAGGSPSLVGDALIFNCDGKTNPCVVALHKDNGQLLWKFDRPTTARRKYSFSTPLAITVNGKPRVITPGSGMVNALNPETGEEIWRVRYDEGWSVVPCPVFGHGLVFTCSGDDNPPTLLAIRTGGQGDVTDTHVAWQTTRGVPVTPSPLLVGDELYLVSDSGILSCYDAPTGKLHYQERVCSNTSASPVFADGRIYVQGEQGLGVVLKPGKQLMKLAENPLGERTLASYCVTDNAIYIRGENNLYCIRKQ